MSESGGTTTQSGVYYQNSIAALYLGRLLDPLKRSAADRVSEVRVESPEHVDDIVVRHADGGHSYIQAKEHLEIRGEPWKKLWINFEKQTFAALNVGERFSLILVISKQTDDIGHLRELCERAHGKANISEWWGSLKKNQLAIANKIIAVLSQTTKDAAYKVLRNTEVWVWPLERLEPDYVPLWIPTSNTESVALFHILRDMVGGHARIRALFHCTEILDRLSLVHGIIVADAQHWGCDAYRRAIINAHGILCVPGTSLSGPIQKIFMWPQLREMEISHKHRDFEEEDLRWRWDHPAEIIDLRNYPRCNSRRVIINAGAGFGKTTLLHALACALSYDPIFVPALISLDDLIFKKIPVLDYLNNVFNHEYNVKIDWEFLCEHGRAVVFFDGLDELNEKDRVSALNTITKFGARFLEVPFLISVRDTSALNVPLGARVLEIIRLDNEMIERFANAYKEAGAKIKPNELLKQAQRHSDLGHLLRIPLFLALLLATKNSVDDLPRNRAELLEHYLSLLLSPERYKAFMEFPDPIDDMRDAIELIAFNGLENDNIALAESETNKILRTGNLSKKPSEYIGRLLQIGAIRRSGTRLHFVYPIVQEYLAACWLVKNKIDDIANRFCKVVHRPWAQTIQFALEMHPAADQIIRDQLNKPDDVFHTILRLIARCVVNGAIIKPELRLELGNRLGTAWPSESYSIASSIGYLIADGFSDPLPETSFNYISQRWGLQHGGAEILVAKADPALTQMVLEEFLKKDLTYSFYLHDWQTAVDAIAPVALELYLDRVRNHNSTDEEIEALLSLILELNSESIPQKRWLNIAHDMSYPSHMRLVAHIRCKTLDQPEIWKLIDEIISPYFSGVLTKIHKINIVLKLFWQIETTGEHFQALILKTNAPIEPIKYLIDMLLSSDKTKEFKIKLFSKTLKLENLDNERRFYLMLMLAVLSNKAAKDNLTTSLQNLQIEHLNLWAFHLGHFSQEQAIEGLKVLDSMILSPKQFQQIISSLSVGLNYIIEPTVGMAATLDNQCRHPAAPVFVSWVSSRLESYTYTPADRLRVLDDSSQIGCMGLAVEAPILLKEVIKKRQKLTKESDLFEIDYALEAGMRLCERESKTLSEDLLFEVVESTTYNAGRDALNLLLNQCDERIIPRLITIYANVKTRSDSIKGPIFSALERLASRYGKKIIRDGLQLKAVEW